MNQNAVASRGPHIYTTARSRSHAYRLDNSVTSNREIEMDILILAVGTVCAGTFIHTFLTLEVHSKQPARVLVRIGRDT